MDKETFKQMVDETLPDLLKEHLSVYTEVETDFLTGLPRVNVQVFWDQTLISDG